MKKTRHGQEVKRQEFSDGSALVTFYDGTVVILESELAKDVALREPRAANYVQDHWGG